MIQVDFSYKTKKITFSMHYKHQLISFKKLKEFEVSQEQKIAFCEHSTPCNNLGNCYSCPPLAPSLDKYNKENYKNCLVYAFWVDWDFSINSKNRFLKHKNANRTVSPYAFNYGKLLERVLGGKIMIDGRCPLCIKCKRAEGKPCLYPKDRRSSLEALGIHATNLSLEVLKHELSWYTNKDGIIKTPVHVTAIHGLLTNIETEPIEMIKKNRTLT